MAATENNVQSEAEATAPAYPVVTKREDALSWDGVRIIFLCFQVHDALTRVENVIDILCWYSADYFMSVAFLSSMRSKDPNTQVGACIVDPDNRIVGIGYK